MCVHNTYYMYSVLRKCSLIEKWKLYSTVIFISILLYDLFTTDEIPTNIIHSNKCLMWWVNLCMKNWLMFLIIKKIIFYLFINFVCIKPVIFNMNTTKPITFIVCRYSSCLPNNTFKFLFDRRPTWSPFYLYLICRPDSPFPTPCLHCVYGIEKIPCDKRRRGGDTNINIFFQ